MKLNVIDKRLPYAVPLARNPQRLRHSLNNQPHTSSGTIHFNTSVTHIPHTSSKLYANKTIIMPVVLIVGATRGLGASLAKAYASEPTNQVLATARSSSPPEDGN